VDAAGTIHTSPRDSDDARALLGGIGLVGIIAEVEVALQGTTNVRGRSRVVKGDGGLHDDIRNLLKARRAFGGRFGAVWGGLGRLSACSRVAGQLSGRPSGWHGRVGGPHMRASAAAPLRCG
jgi:hypothetical protein